MNESDLAFISDVFDTIRSQYGTMGVERFLYLILT